MRKRSQVAVLVLALGATAAGSAVASEAVQLLLQQYRQQGVGAFDADAGAEFWQKAFDGRSCTSCHTADPRVLGRHRQTGKPIEPMAPSVNPRRLTEVRQMNKWFYRNCNWTLGRECTAQEKGNLLIWLQER
ncbi:DUF1924 domain-containing protein [Marinobacterium aestuariivivens]|uniref:DUF1924 domain-containing protein n=1 Tax=Marinobacterium aestuariivivens TaxID=1698799 RepID=A0ABW2A375_9GAMM